MYLLSSVEFLCLAWRNDALWFLCPVFKSFSVRPMYVSVVLLSLRLVTSRKMIICLFASMFIRSLLSFKMWHISFLMFSVSLGVGLVMASLSSQ